MRFWCNDAEKDDLPIELPGLNKRLSALGQAMICSAGQSKQPTPCHLWDLLHQNAIRQRL
jgi:hypothetical protein